MPAVCASNAPDWKAPFPPADWESDNVLLYCRDCLDILPQIPDGAVDAVVTDPPYGISHCSHGQRFYKARPLRGDDDTDLAASVSAWADQYAIPLVMFFSPFRMLSYCWRSVLCWKKGAHVGGGGDRATCWKRDFELIGVRQNVALNGKRDTSVIDVPGLLPAPTGHIAEKPVALMRYLVFKVSQQMGLVLDPCMGSGTTGVASVLIRRRFVGVDIDPDYFAIAVKRIERAIRDEAAQFAFAREHGNNGTPVRQPVLPGLTADG